MHALKQRWSPTRMAVGLLCLIGLGCGQGPAERPGEEMPQEDRGVVTSPLPHWLFPVSFGSRPLEFSNGNKIVVGRFNSLHAVYQTGLLIKYTTSLDGSAWTAPINLNGSTPSQFPAISADSSGNIGVVWVANPTANGMGVIKYAYKPAASSTWTTITLTNSGAEPAIIGHGTTMYVAWTTIQMVQYTSFPTLTPPTTPLASGEILESASCPNTGFRKPSITLISSPCKPPVPRVAYLYYSDEQGTSGACQSLQTQIGPHVCERNNTTGVWSLIYNNTINDSNPTSSVEAISCSISANFSTGHTFLAWSDQQTGVARTVLARGVGATWTASNFDNQRHHVHVRANGAGSAPATQFRLAWTGGGSVWDEFISPNTFWDTATWTGAAPVWTGATNLSNYGGYTGRPQSIFWKRCSSGQYSTTNAYFEAEGACASAFVATDFSTVTGCPTTPVTPISVSPCAKYAVAVAQVRTLTAAHTLVDTRELGTVVRLTANSATITTEAGGTVTATWEQGSVVHSWDNGFTVTAPRSSLRFSSADTQFTQADYGFLNDYEPSRMGATGTCPK